MRHNTASLLFTLVVCQCFQSDLSSTEPGLTGHLKPLGGHRPPESNLVDELFVLPDPQEFWTKYVKPSRAAVLRGAIRHSRAFTEWTDEYLKKHFGELEVRLEGKKEKSGTRVPIGARGVGRDTIGNFVDNMHGPNAKAYIVSELPTPMWKDVTVIPPLTCGTWKDRLVEVDLWMSGGDTHSILHKDAFNAINCLINGTKKWKMIEYKHEDKIYKAWEPPQMVGGYSRINVKKVDLIKYPRVAEVPWSDITITAGDCLFLPKSYYHQVSSFGDSNIAVALLFSRFDDVEELDFKDCSKTPKYTPLSEMELDWQYPGYGNLTMGLTHVEDVRAGIKLFFNGEKILDKKALIRKSGEKRPQPKKYVEYYQQNVQQQSQKLFELMGGNEKGYIALEDVDKLSREDMRRIVWAFEGTDISNREDYEYGYIAFRDINSILSSLLENDGHIDRKLFIDRYIKDLGGTRKFATELLDRLGAKGSEHISQREYEKNIQKALQPYEDNSQEDSEEDVPPSVDGKAPPEDAYVEDEDEESGNENEQVLQQKTGANDESSSRDEL